MGKVVDVAAGQAAPPAGSFDKVGTPFIRAGSVEGLIARANWQDLEHLSEASAKQRRMKLFPPGTVLFAKSGMSAALGRVFKIDRPAYVVSHLAALKPTGQADPAFLAYWLQFYGTQRLIKAPAYPSIRLADVEEMPFPDLSLPEQRRIAGILDQADALRRLRRRSLSRLSALGQAIFYEMFGDPVANPKGWPLGTIRDLLADAKYGTAQKASSTGPGLPILRMGNLTYEGQIKLDDLKYVELSAKDFPKYTTMAGDLLFNRTNSKELVGKTAVVETAEPLAIAGYLIRARTNKRANPHYISAYLNSAPGKAVLRNMCKNIVGMANINAQEMQNIVIAHPPVELQNEFADRLAAISIRRAVHEEAMQQTDSLFASLQHRAFRGEL
jgi:type I restriction enzyme S subunit